MIITVCVICGFFSGLLGLLSAFKLRWFWDQIADAPPEYTYRAFYFDSRTEFEDMLYMVFLIPAIFVMLFPDPIWALEAMRDETLKFSDVDFSWKRMFIFLGACVFGAWVDAFISSGK